MQLGQTLDGFGGSTLFFLPVPSPQLPVSLTHNPQETSLSQAVRMFTKGVKSRALAGYDTAASVSSPAVGRATVACGIEDSQGSGSMGILIDQSSSSKHHQTLG